MVPGDHGRGEGLLTATAGEAFEERAARAAALAAQGGSTAELLRFAADLLRLQAKLAMEIAKRHERRPWQGSAVADRAELLPRWDDFLKGLRKSPAPEIAAEAKRLLAAGAEERWAPVESFWEATGEAEDFLARAFLRPYAETLRTLSIAIARPRPEGYCPTCGGAPGISLRRTGPESEAGHRYLVCALCGGEWSMVRIRCPLCQETDPVKLPLYSSEQHAGVRLEVCDTCHHYVKSIDLTRDARAIPEVDDLVSVALDLWAQEQGYSRIEPGIAGI